MQFTITNAHLHSFGSLDFRLCGDDRGVIVILSPFSATKIPQDKARGKPKLFASAGGHGVAYGEDADADNENDNAGDDPVYTITAGPFPFAREKAINVTNNYGK